jgi:integrase
MEKLAANIDSIVPSWSNSPKEDDMSSHRFDPTLYRGKKTIYMKVPTQSNISAIWDWSDKSKKYVKRSIGEKYYAYVRNNGKQLSRCFKSLDEAKEFVRYKGILPEITEQLTFLEVKEKFFSWYKGKVGTSTFETMQGKSKLLNWFDHYPMESLTPRLVDKWLVHLKSPSFLKTQQSTRMSFQKELAALRQICLHYKEYFCEESDYLIPIKKRHKSDCIVDPQAYKRRQSLHKTKYMPRENIQAFLKEMFRRANVRGSRKVYYLIALFQLRTGCRVGEVCALSWSDLDLNEASAHIFQTVAWSRSKDRETYISPLTKTGESRRVFFTDDVVSRAESMVYADWSADRSGV